MTPFLQACRSLRRRPAFVATSVLTLAFGIAVTTALFSVVDSILLKPLPFPDGDRLVTVYEASPAQRERVSLVAPARLDDWNRLSQTFASISGSYAENVTDTSGAEPERLAGRRVMSGFFQVFGMTPIAGRLFTEDEERFGGPTTAIISEALWSRRYGRSPAAVGARLTIGARGYTIVGVMPRSFTSAAVDIWIPAQLHPRLLQQRNARFVGGVGRMQPGVTIAQAREDLSRVQQMLGAQYPKTDEGWSASIEDLKTASVGEHRGRLLLVFGAVGVLLLIAIANVAGLVLVQLHRRALELAVRSAIGASRRQVIGSVMREVAILGAAGAILGGAGATWLVALIVRTFDALPRSTEIVVDWRAAAFVVLVTVGAAFAAGFLPALLATRGSLARAISEGGRSGIGGPHRFQSALVVAQIALSLALAGCAGLLLRSYQQLHRTDIGFNTSHVLTFHVGAAWDEDRARVGRLQEELVAELQQLPGVLAAGITSFLPATGATLRYQILLDGITGPEPGGRLTVGTRTMSAGYLRALQAPLVAGEWCPDLRSDRKAPPTALVNQRLVDLHAAGQDVIGRRFRFDFEQHDGWRIVGVVGNMVEDGPGAQPAPYVYVCAPAGAWPDPEYVVRSAGDPAALMPAIRQVVRRLDPNRPIFGVRLLDDVMADALEQPRLNSALLTGFASAAIALAALGLYGLLTLYVTERRRELGVRLALGAAPADVVRLVFAGAGRLVALGMASGLVLILGTGRMLRTLLFGVTSLDVPALFGAIAVLAIASLAAVWFPARRAARISAIEVIRES